jgi:hypothetical protein
LAPTVDPEEQRRLQELDAARLSALFAEAQTVPRSGAQATPTPPQPARSSPPHWAARRQTIRFPAGRRSSPAP